MTKFFYVHGTLHLGNTSFIKYQRDLWYTPVAATTVCKNYSWWWTQTASETCSYKETK